MSKRHRTSKRGTSSFSVTYEENMKEEDPLSEKTLPKIQVQQHSPTNSDCEDFLGFEATDVKSRIVNASTGEVYVVFQEDDNNVKDDTNQLDSTSDETQEDDDLIVVENNVEVIEIDDDDDNEFLQPPPPPQPTQTREYSFGELQLMVYSNHSQIELRKPNLNWKSDQFRLIYVNGTKQNVCICTQCSELCKEINIDTIVRHAKCNPKPSVSPGPKRTKITPKTKPNCDNLKKTVQNFRISKIQTIAAGIDVQSSTFFQRKEFLKFAEFLINAGATLGSTFNELKFDPKYDELCKTSNQLQDAQLTQICSILNTPDLDFSFSCDVWEDIMRRKTNVLLEMHYLDSTTWKRRRLVIGVRSINGIKVDEKSIYEQIIQILERYSSQFNETKFFQKATAFVTMSKNLINLEGCTCFPSACSIINDIANNIIHEPKLGVSQMCVQIIALINLVSREKVFEFDDRKWEKVYQLMEIFIEKKALILRQNLKPIFPNEKPIVQLLQPFHVAIKELSDPKNNISKVFGHYKLLENHLMPHATDKGVLKTVKIDALANLSAAFANSDFYQICMFLDPSNRNYYNSLESDEMDGLKSKINAMINPYTRTRENGCVESDLVEYMDDSVATQQNQIDLFLQSLIPNHDDVYVYWRDSLPDMAGLKKLARKYLTIPTYASLSECVFSKEARQTLQNRNNLQIRDLEAMLMMKSLHLVADDINLDC